MIKVGPIHSVLAYLSISVASISLILMGLSALLARQVGFQFTSYMFITVVGALFAIYFFIGASIFRDKQIPRPFARKVARRELELPPALLEHRAFSVLGSNKGLRCPFKPGTCQAGFCKECQIYLDWQNLGEHVVACALCGRDISRESGAGEPGVSLAMCPDCWQLFWTD